MLMLVSAAAAPISLEEFDAAIVASLTVCDQDDAAEKKECVAQRTAAARIASKGTRIAISLGDVPLTKARDGKAQLQVARKVLIERELEAAASDCAFEWNGHGLNPPISTLTINAAAGKTPLGREAPLRETEPMIAVFEVSAFNRKVVEDAAMKKEKHRQLISIDGQLNQARVSLSGISGDELDEVAPQLAEARAQRRCVAAFSPQALKITVELRLVGGLRAPDRVLE